MTKPLETSNHQCASPSILADNGGKPVIAAARNNPIAGISLSGNSDTSGLTHEVCSGTISLSLASQTTYVRSNDQFIIDPTVKSLVCLRGKFDYECFCFSRVEE